MGGQLKREWGAVALRGLVAVLFGMALLFWPGVTLELLLTLFGLYALVSGIVSVVGSLLKMGKISTWWIALLPGIVSLVVGIYVLIWPAVAALVIFYVVALWALVTGMLDIIAAVMSGKEMEGLLLTISGIASVLFGVLALRYPVSGALALIWMLAYFSIFIGIMLLILAFHVRKAGQQLAKGARTTTGKPASGGR